MTWAEFKKLEDELRAEGWLRYVASGDVKVDEAERCEACGHPIGYHTGFKAPGRFTSSGYRAFAVCYECNAVYEF